MTYRAFKTASVNRPINIWRTSRSSTIRNYYRLSAAAGNVHASLRRKRKPGGIHLTTNETKRVPLKKDRIPDSYKTNSLLANRIRNVLQPEKNVAPLKRNAFVCHVTLTRANLYLRAYHLFSFRRRRIHRESRSQATMYLLLVIAKIHEGRGSDRTRAR